MFKEFPVFTSYFEEVQIVAFQTLPSYNLHSADKKIRVPDDLKGLKIGSAGPLADFMSIAGGTPVSIAGPDAYMALKTGQEDAQAADWNLIGNFKLHEVTSYHLDYDRRKGER
jgi:TRAP-type C4-dicarboxylate transport system substrate-binding protein